MGKIPNINHVDNVAAVFTALHDAIEYMKTHEVPESYWKERMRWFVTHDLRQPGTLKEKKRNLDVMLREITEQYVLDREGLSA